MTLTTRSLTLALPQQASTKPISLLFTSAGKVTPLYKALSTDFHRGLDFYAARDSKVGEEAMRAFGVEKTPALLVLRGGDDVARYDGASRALSLSLSFRVSPGLDRAGRTSSLTKRARDDEAGPLKYDKLHAFLKPFADKKNKDQGAKAKDGKHEEL